MYYTHRSSHPTCWSNPSTPRLDTDDRAGGGWASFIHDLGGTMTQRFVVESDDLGLWGIWDTSQHTFTSQGTPVRAWAGIMADALNERGQVQPECASGVEVRRPTAGKASLPP